MIRGTSAYGYLGDPGPCPVDDTPHTACTPASVAAQAITVPIAGPIDRRVVVPVPPPRFATPPVPTATTTIRETVSTKTYRGRRAGRR